MLSALESTNGVFVKDKVITFKSVEITKANLETQWLYKKLKPRSEKNMTAKITDVSILLISCI